MTQRGATSSQPFRMPIARPQNGEEELAEAGRSPSGRFWRVKRESRRSIVSRRLARFTVTLTISSKGIKYPVHLRMVQQLGTADRKSPAVNRRLLLDFFRNCHGGGRAGAKRDKPVIRHQAGTPPFQRLRDVPRQFVAAESGIGSDRHARTAASRDHVVKRRDFAVGAV